MQPLLDSFTTARTLQVLRAAPISVVRLLRSLPAAYHPLIIEAQVYSACLSLKCELLPVCCRPAPGLSALTFLTSLSLPHTDAAACLPELFAAALEPLTSLVHLNLHDSGITASSVPAFAGAIKCLTALKHVDLSSNVLLRSGVDALIPALKHLTNISLLHLSRNSIIAARSSVQQILSILPLLKSLDISHNSALYPDSDEDRVTSVPHPGDSLEQQERLRLQAAHSRAVQFSTVPSLEELLLVNAGLENSDFVSFVAPLLMSAAPSLTCLNLSENGLTAMAAPYICDPMNRMACLRELHLSSCAFTAADVCMMLEALQNARAALLSDDEDHQVAGPMLEHLNVAYMDTHLMVDADAVIIGRCKALRSLDISCIEMPVQSMDVVQIQELTALTALDISSSLLYAEFAEQIRSLTSLLSLKASSACEEMPASEFLQSLALLTALTDLDLSDNNLEDSAGLAHALRGLTDMKHLDLAHNDLLQPKSQLPAALAVLSSLRMLALSGNAVDAECASELALAVNQLTDLTALMLDEMSRGPDATLALGAALQTLTGLSALDLTANELTKSSQPMLTSMLRRMPHLQELELAGIGLDSNGVQLVANAVADLPRLSVLVLNSNAIPASIAAAAGKAFQRMERLRNLDVSSSRLGHKGLTLLSRGIRECTSLQTINLGDIGTIEDRPIQGAGWEAVLAALAALPGLRDLVLGDNVFTRTLVSESIKPIISRMTALQALNIENCEGNTEIVAAWIDAIAPLTGLNELAIGGNTLPANVGSLLSEFCLLEDLSLSDSGLSDNDLHVLSRELVALSGLRMLTLSLNDLSEAAVASAAEVLPRVIIEFEQDDDDEAVSMDDDETDDDISDDEDGSDSDDESEESS